jgi:hypothetical protein
MKKIFLIILTASVLFITACQTSTEVKKDDHAGHSNQDMTAKTTEDFLVEFNSNPAQFKAGEKTEMTFTVKNAKGETVQDFQIVHEKPLHLLIVSEDLVEFYHEHPELQSNGSFKVPFTFKNGGRFKIYADFTPKNSKQTVKSFTIDVTGNERPREELKADEKFEKTVDDLLVTMKSDGAISSGKDLTLHFQVFDAKTKKPVTDLQNYLGEKAHFVIISQDLRDFVHAHPASRDNVKDGHNHGSEVKHDEKLAGVEAESIVSARLAFPAPVLYKIFAQFQRNGKVTTVPFVVAVKADGDSASNIKPVEVPKDAYKVTVTKDGYVPGEITFSKGKFSKIAFYRADAEGCGDEVVFKSLNIRKKLPIGEVVIVDLPKDFSGELAFTCGMNMFKGKLMVE